MNITAEEAGTALSSIAGRLLENSIVTNEGYSVLQRVCSDLKRQKNSINWALEIDPGERVTFEQVLDKNGASVTPALVARINVKQEDKKCHPFLSLDIAIEIENLVNDPISRWHLDLANSNGSSFQDGPLIHLQYGGHNRNNRSLDHPLKVPRWSHPPMEVALMCEIIAANFFTEIWQEMRRDPTWCRSISIFQKLCFTDYLEKMKGTLSVSSTTSLNEMWAGNWTS